jgi:hypothetical protein
MHRFYALQVLPTLFGDWTLTTKWGRIGAMGQVQHRFFPDEAAAAARPSSSASRTRFGVAMLPQRLNLPVNRREVRSREPHRDGSGGNDFEMISYWPDLIDGLAHVRS